ncbi:discoidin domain-containing protein [Streptomyces sp. YC504]|uniref:Discoidin domain-containing protein n=1 Tax=Streptomyces mesophilus TaxID=1775132 RepID=A0A6G4XRG4_9ACTN|nr:discoidin domain-containing protein [Streptomyces mesophilus]NGO79380.1 discoidin domain-containing protein [Streptomyces mesophilus]
MPVGISIDVPPPPRRRLRDLRLRRFTAGALLSSLAGTLLAVTPATGAAAAESLLSQGRTTTASSTEGAGYAASAAVDGNLTGTRWASQWQDDQWIQVDLGRSAQLSRAVLTWEAAYGKSYEILASDNGTDWRTVTTVSAGDGGTDELSLSGSGRYIRMNGKDRATGYGFSLWEFQVYGSTDGGTNLPGGGDLGPNVHVFDPSTPGVQAKLDAVFQEQESAQFGAARHAFLFKPGTYNGLNAQIGFYTQIAGLGLRPDDTTINGDVTVDAGWFNGNATQNFWRGAEGLALNPVSGTNRWAVSQASSFRRMHVKGGLNLAPNGYGWASGGYIADSKIDGQVGNYSQQQWYTRDSSIGGWSNSVWNQTFSGVEGAPATSFPEPRYTTLANTPISREKPYLIWEDNQYKVFAPDKRTNARGTTWSSGTPQGKKLPLSSFYVVKPGATAATINQALDQGLHLLFTPGVYHVDQTINVNRADTIVLGLGLATIIPDNGVTAMRVADVDGVRLAGFLIDAGAVNSPTLLEVGPQGSGADHAANPTTVQDVYIRIGGAGPGKATTSMVVNSDDTIVDHTWVWRADHGDGVGWETNRADYGVRVNGDDVLATGLFVEHFNKYDVEWYGERGRTVFFQNEKAYDAPNQAAIQNGSTRGYAAYRVDDSVDTHEAWGLGSYCFYNVDPTIIQDHAFKTPVKPGIKFHSLLTVSLSGNGHFDHVINDTGASTVPNGSSTVPSTVVAYP